MPGATQGPNPKKQEQCGLSGPPFRGAPKHARESRRASPPRREIPAPRPRPGKGRFIPQDPALAKCIKQTMAKSQKEGAQLRGAPRPPKPLTLNVFHLSPIQALPPIMLSGRLVQKTIACRQVDATKVCHESPDLAPCPGSAARRRLDCGWAAARIKKSEYYSVSAINLPFRLSPRTSNLPR